MMIDHMRPIGTAAIASHLRLGNRPGTWCVVLVDPAAAKVAALEVESELESVMETPALAAESTSVADFVASTEKAPEGALLLVYGLDGLNEDDWSTLDRLRSNLQSRAGVVLFLSRGAFAHLSRRAPNLSSWIGAAFWKWSSEGDALPEDAREDRLSALRTRFKLTDDEVISAASEGRLPREPEFGEWLVLIGRSDLLG